LIGFEFIFKDNQVHTRLKVRDQFHVRYLTGPGVFPTTYSYSLEAADISDITRCGDQELIYKVNNEMQTEYFLRLDKAPTQEHKLLSHSEACQQLLTSPYPTAEQRPIFLNFNISNPKDGLKIPTGLAISQGVKPGQKIPAIIYLHGGPESYEDNDPSERHYVLFAQSFALFVPNVRGSTEVSSLHYTAAKGQMEGLINEDIAAVARYAASLEFIDANNIFLWGDSAGGSFTASALLSHENPFKAGICCAGVYDWAEHLKSESNVSYGIGHKIKESWMKRFGLKEDPVLNPDENKRISPVHRLSLLKKPLLFLHGTADDDVGYSQTSRVQQEAKDLNISPTLIKVKLIEGADHDFSEHQKEYYSAILEFINQQMTN
jgi:dipeptidyl aminopeptidase/acylaminoacyl peptidase